MTSTKHLAVFSLILILTFDCKSKINEFQKTQQYIVIAVPESYIREKPDFNSKIVGSVPFHTRIAITRDTKENIGPPGWDKITFQNITGFINLNEIRSDEIPLKILRSKKSSDGKFELIELNSKDSEQNFCGFWHSGFCTMQIIDLENQKIIFEKINYKFEDFLDEKNIVISYGGGESCDEHFRYLNINLETLEESIFLKYSFETINCNEDNKSNKYIHHLCIKNNCFTINEGESSYTIKNDNTGISKIVESEDHFKFKRNTWKNPEIEINGKKYNFLEYFYK
ncbi:SH3 domain-containing protein [Leptospira bourretii]|uniref:SH3 domain-containing protein n=1 Tax=Leptospira bourretii TaxID=2484962 RepID=A0A4R9IMJ8_9LEPT|nr:SH3 domain-containing protein [Leptospira bourretii]TGK89991.1 SH3 domain-containing protein [Leptospira bourretii]TGK92214.1 SH3 domain-containing protein [Leptospira bourretii]TGL19774.1 SH3 domain-containing protein [Leptospira bourretii]TGL27493.1 SH3 domain-containing protein [Leptospira bourretii]